ncbi:MAG TPA: alpha/beta hydrolase, partial [Candidatus Caenarcaniphilales bacterium]
MLCILPTAANPARGAEQVSISYAAFERSIKIEALDLYAKEGRVTDDLASYTRYFNSEQLAQLRKGLRTRVNLDPITVSQFLYSPIGERLLYRLGEVIQTPSRQSGFYALRAALILAAAEPEGLTALSALRQFPTQGIHVDLAKALNILQGIEKLVNQTAIAVTTVRNKPQAADSSVAVDTDISQVHGLQAGGPFAWQKETLLLNDTNRMRLGRSGSTRTFLADIYLPEVAQLRPLPVIVLSHGLGSDRLTYDYLAEHLASYGFVVAVPEHPGSSAQQLLALLDGQAREVAEPTEFVDRPLDIKFLLDELSWRSRSDPTFYRRLNLEQVGVIGHSFGGYTALALAGAKLNFEQLKHDCGKNLDHSLNVSLLLQCRALTLPKQNYDLYDPRVKAVIAMSPVDRSIFGSSGLSQIKIPVMLIAGSADTVAPALLEQIQPFTWLTTSQKYLMVIEGATHFSTTGEAALSSGVFPVPPAIVGPAANLARSYVDALSVAFFQTYVANQPLYARYLTRAYA